MIETKIVNQLPVIVHHRVKGTLSVNEARSGAANGLAVIKQAIDMGRRLHLLIDMRGYVFENLASHKIWSIDFKHNQLLSKYVDYVAVVDDPVPKFFAEKEMMQTDELKFFTDYHRAFEWLRSQVLLVSEMTR